MYKKRVSHSIFIVKWNSVKLSDSSTVEDKELLYLITAKKIFIGFI